jgi:hypothetical protein
MAKLEFINNHIRGGIRLLDITYEMASELPIGATILVEPDNENTPTIPFTENFYCTGKYTEAIVIDVAPGPDENSLAIELKFDKGVIRGHGGSGNNGHNRYYIYINSRDAMYT